THAEKCRPRKRHHAPCRLAGLDQVARIAAGKRLEQPHHQDERKKADKQRRHDYFICSSSRIAPVLRRADRSLSSFRPPAAYAATSLSSSRSSWAALVLKRQ